MRLEAKSEFARADPREHPLDPKPFGAGIRGEAGGIRDIGIRAATYFSKRFERRFSASAAIDEPEERHSSKPRRGDGPLVFSSKTPRPVAGVLAIAGGSVRAGLRVIGARR